MRQLMHAGPQILSFVVNFSGKERVHQGRCKCMQGKKDNSKVGYLGWARMLGLGAWVRFRVCLGLLGWVDWGTLGLNWPRTRSRHCSERSPNTNTFGTFVLRTLASTGECSL